MNIYKEISVNIQRWENERNSWYMTWELYLVTSEDLTCLTMYFNNTNPFNIYSVYEIFLTINTGTGLILQWKKYIYEVKQYFRIY
jgi:hypothetical protein